MTSSDDLREAAEAELARRNLLDFTKYTFRGDYKANWHHRLIARELEKVANFDTRKLIITTPPRVGKTELVSRRLISWFMGRRPTKNVIFATHSEALMRRTVKDVRSIQKEPTYRNVFPDFEFGDSQSSEELSTAQGGVVKGTTIKSGIHGFGAHLGIIDDYFRNRSDAESDLEREKLWDFYSDDFSSRLMYPSAQIVMATRFHQDDLIGRLLERSDDWRVIHLPFIQDDPDPPPYDPRDKGEPIWPGFFAQEGEDADEEELVRRAIEYYQERKRNNPYGTEALYQGRPTPRGGDLFERDWLKAYSSTPEQVHDAADEVVLSVDATFKASKRSDKVALTVLAKKGRTYYLLDERCEKLDFTSTLDAIHQLLTKWPRSLPLVEDKANGPAIMDKLRRELPRVEEYNPGRDSKDARASAAADTIRRDGLFVPDENRYPWVTDWKEDIVGYPGRKYDDRVDALSQAIIRWDDTTSPLDNLKRTLGRR